MGEALNWTGQGEPRDAGSIRFANWDEDALTMAVAAAMDCGDLSGIEEITVASTTLPFADRSNAGLVSAALGRTGNVRVRDVTGSQRAATTALQDALDRGGTELLLATDRRAAQVGSSQELRFGHGAVACITGRGDLLLRVLGRADVGANLVDHYRASSARYDYALEDRWVRDEGHLKLLPDVMTDAVRAAGIDVADVSAVAAPLPRASQRKLANAGLLPNARWLDDRVADVGDIGVGHGLLMLTEALPTLAEGDIVLLCGFGQGADALILQRTATPRQDEPRPAEVRDEPYYTRFLAHGGALTVDWGPRAERDNRTAHSAHYRRHDAVDAFMGGRCDQCGTPQFPRARVCVECQAIDSQRPYSFAHRTARVKSYTEDWQAFSPSPPLIYGNVRFAGGGNVYMEFTDFAPGEVAVGDTVSMAYRIKDKDDRRGFHRYFWKATPARG